VSLIQHVPRLYADVNCSWIAFAPVADFTRAYFGLSSSTPVNWLSTVVLFVYCVLSPVTAYVYHHHGVRLGVSPLKTAKLIPLAHYWRNSYCFRSMAQVRRSKNKSAFVPVGYGRPNHYWSRPTVRTEHSNSLQ
jgi:hypothetical protein